MNMEVLVRTRDGNVYIHNNTTAMDVGSRFLIIINDGNKEVYIINELVKWTIRKDGTDNSK